MSVTMRVLSPLRYACSTTRRFSKLATGAWLTGPLELPHSCAIRDMLLSAAARMKAVTACGDELRGAVSVFAVLLPPPHAASTSRMGISGVRIAHLQKPDDAPSEVKRTPSPGATTHAAVCQH